MRYIAFDVETPNRYNNRMSAIGISVIENGAVIESFYSLVDPETDFDAFNTWLTGIDEDKVRGAPNFAGLWPQIEPLLAQNGVPDDLKYLMAIESNLSETAVSVSGAAGLWQFMREVGKEYGLEVTPTVDERYNLEKETDAACKYLKKAYARFGDWMTVAASFNGGINGITRRREVQRQPKAMDLHLVEETSRYMFRILAAKMMFEDPSLFGFELEERDLYPYIPPKQVVKVSESIEDLAEFAERYGISYAQLRRANPWLRDTKLTAAKGKTYEIAIPDIVAEREYFLYV